MNSVAPICLFTFNRLDHAQQTIENLLKNEEASKSLLYIFSDGPRNEIELGKVEAVRQYLRSIKGFHAVSIIERERNIGLANSIIDGVTRVVNEHGQVIVLEDDLVTSRYFLKFMNEALSLYRDEPRVASIHGYVYPVAGLPETFFIKGADCWGWATWKDRWAKFNPNGAELLSRLQTEKLTREFDFDGSYPYVKMLKNQIVGKNNSWAIRWYASAFLDSMFTLYPGKSLVRNIGHDNTGTHCNSNDDFEVALREVPLKLKYITVETHPGARAEFVRFFKSLKKPFHQRVVSAIKKRMPWARKNVRRSAV